MSKNVYDRYMKENPEEYAELKQRIREWLENNREKSYPRTAEIAEEVVDTDKLKGGFHARLAAIDIDDLGLEEWNPSAQHSRIRNPFAFGDTV
jgi:hypothetical protein